MLGQAAPTREWCCARGGDVGVFGYKERVKPAFLNRFAKGHGVDGFISGEDADAKVGHGPDSVKVVHNHTTAGGVRGLAACRCPYFW